MKNCFLPLLPLAFATIVSAAENNTAPKTPGHIPVFESDYVCFKAPNAQSYVEIYNQIAFSQLSFRRLSMRQYMAAVSVDISLQKQDEQIVRNLRTDTLRVQSYEETVTSRDVLSCLQSYIIDAGTYFCRIVVTDQLTGRMAVKKIAMQVPAFSTPALNLSEIQFASHIIEAKEEGPFIKSGLYVEPNPNAAYSFFATTIPVYYEIYNIPVAAKAPRKYLLVDFIIFSQSSGEMVKKISRGSYFSARECIQSALLPVAELTPGGYNLKIVVTDPERKTVAVTQRLFSVGREVVSNSILTIDDLVNQLKFIATEAEIRQLQYMNSRQKRQALLRFWAAKDPTPNSPDNERMQEFYRRLDFVNHQFSTPERHGWETEAGRIYMQLGPPDRISRGRYLNQQKPCEVWTYKNLKCKYFLLSGHEVIKMRI